MEQQVKKKIKWKTGYWVVKDDIRYHISVREKQCIDLLLAGYSMKVSANILNISYRTIEYYLSNVRLKLNCPNKCSIVKFFYNGAVVRKVSNRKRKSKRGRKAISQV